MVWAWLLVVGGAPSVGLVRGRLCRLASSTGLSPLAMTVGTGPDDSGHISWCRSRSVCFTPVYTAGEA